MADADDLCGQDYCDECFYAAIHYGNPLIVFLVIKCCLLAPTNQNSIISTEFKNEKISSAQ